MEEIQRDTPPETRPETEAHIPPPGQPLNDADPADPQRIRARKRLDDASAHVTAEARIESREQVREIMGWA